MDVVQDWAAYYLMGDHAEYAPYARQALGAAYTVKSWVLPIVDQISQKPDLATIALLLIIVLISLKILNMLYQTVMFWVRTIWRVVFYGGLVALALWMYTRGPEGVAADMSYWYETWNGEYQRFKDQERVAKLMHQKPATGRGSGWY